MSDFTHLHVGVGAELFVLFLLVEFVPPLMGATFVSGGSELSGVVEGEAFLTVVNVVALDAESFAGGEEGEGSEAGTVGLNGEGIEAGHETPFAGEVVKLHVESLASGVGFAAVGELGSLWARRSVFIDFELKGALFKFADAVEVVFEAIFGGLAERGVFSGVVSVLLEDGIEDAALESLIEAIGSLNAAEDACEEVDGTFLHGGGNSAIGMIRVDVAGDAAASEKGAGDEGRYDAIGLAFGIVSAAEELIEGSSTGAGLAVGWRGREGGGRAIKVGIDAGFVGAAVVNSSHNEEFVGEGLEGFHDPGEAFLLKGRGDAEAEEDVEGTHGDEVVRGLGGGGHFFEEREADGGAGDATEEGAAVHGI